MREHGGDIYSRKITYDFSANINPFGMPESVAAVLKERIAAVEHYPDPDCREIADAIATHYGCKNTEVLCGNGAVDLIYRFASARRPKSALLCSPCFGEYEKALRLQSTRISYYELKKEQDFTLEEDFLDALKSVDCLFLCIPNNPTGQIIEESLLFKIRSICREKKITLVLDLCFIDFTDYSLDSLLKSQSVNEVFLFAFTKNYALPGLRLGFVLAKDTDLLEQMKAAGPNWNVSSLAQLAGTCALKETNYLEETKALITAERAFMEDKLNELGFVVYPSKANFLLFESKWELEKALEQQEIGIRNCGNFKGLDETFYRIAIRKREENLVLLEALERICHG